MVYVRYLGPGDTFDASLILGKEGMVFHTPTNMAVNEDERGTILQVTNEGWEELRTYPNYFFAEVPGDEAKAIVAAQTQARRNREQLAALRAQHEGGPPRPTYASPVAAPATATVEVAPAAPRVADEVQKEARADVAGLKEAKETKETKESTPAKEK